MSYNYRQMRHALASRLLHPGSMLAGLLALSFTAVGCGVGSDDPMTQSGASGSNGNTAGASSAQGGSSAGGTGATGTALGSDFELRPEFAGPCSKANPVDINLGNSAQAFVRAAYCQVNGKEPDEAANAMA